MRIALFTLIIGAVILVVGASPASAQVSISCGATDVQAWGQTCAPTNICGLNQSAQSILACLTTLPSCDGTSTNVTYNDGSVHTVAGAQGSALDCNSCGCACPSGQVACVGTTISSATNSAAECQASEAGAECNYIDANDNDDGRTNACGACVSCNTPTYINCIAETYGCITATESGQIQADAICLAGQAPNQCGVCQAVTYTPVYLNYYQDQGGGISITGDIKSTNGDLRLTSETEGLGNVYLNSGKAIRVDKKGASTLMIGNYRTDPNPSKWGTDFRLTLHAQNNNLAELILQQGSNDRWALSVRPNTSNFTIWRTVPDTSGPPGAVKWDADPLLAIDYATGNVSIANDLSVGGQVSGAALCIGADCKSSWDAVGMTQNQANGLYLQLTGGTLIGNLNIGDNNVSANLTVTGNVSASGSVTASGCFGPVFARTTPAVSTGNAGGYTGAHDLCIAGPTNDPADDDPAAHVCSTSEILESVRCGTRSGLGQAPIFSNALANTFAWISNGPPGFTANANDCLGWTEGTGILDGQPTYGAVWQFSDIGGRGGLTQCDSPLQFACCR